MAAPRLSFGSMARSHGGQFWYQAQRMPTSRVPTFIGHLKVLIDFDMDDLAVVRGFTPVDTGTLQEAWTASKKIGRVVADDILKLVKMRNETARELGYSNYHEMSLKLAEQGPKDIDLIFDDLYERTKDVFFQIVPNVPSGY